MTFPTLSHFYTEFSLVILIRIQCVFKKLEKDQICVKVFLAHSIKQKKKQIQQTLGEPNEYYCLIFELKKQKLRMLYYVFFCILNINTTQSHVVNNRIKKY